MTFASVPGAPVVTVPIANVGAGPVAPSAPVGPVGPVAPSVPVARLFYSSLLFLNGKVP